LVNDIYQQTQHPNIYQQTVLSDVGLVGDLSTVLSDVGFVSVVFVLNNLMTYMMHNYDL
ncbi:hypothetical protein GIB67_025153, partial [Kingdonia uniflora]